MPNRSLIHHVRLCSVPNRSLIHHVRLCSVPSAAGVKTIDAPLTLWTVPEISSVGLTLDQAIAQGVLSVLI